MFSILALLATALLAQFSVDAAPQATPPDDTSSTPAPSDADASPPTQAQNEDDSSADAPHTVPYKRLQQVIAERNAEREARAELEKQIAERERIAAEEQGKYKELYESLQPKAQRADALEQTVKQMLEARIAEIPEHFRALVPEGDATTQLAWINKAAEAGAFKTPSAPNLDPGAQGDGKKPISLTPEQKRAAKAFGISEEKFAENLNVGNTDE